MLQAEDSLTTAAVAGDQAALRGLLRRHDPHLRRQLTGKIRPTHRSAFDVDDILQVTYLEAYLRVEQFNPDGPGSFRAWLTRIAENNLQDAIRSLGREKRPPREKQVRLPSLEDSYVTLFLLLGGTTHTPSKHLARQDAEVLLEAALTKLPRDYETVVRLSDLQGLAGSEVARAMNRTLASVYMLKGRAHARLAELLGSPSQF